MKISSVLKLIAVLTLDIMISRPVFAELPDLGPPAGTMAKVGSATEGSATIYKTQKVWEDLRPGQWGSWTDPQLSLVEAGASVKVTKQATYDNAAWFLSQVRILSGQHSGETWWIHSKTLVVVKAATKALKSGQKQLPYTKRLNARKP